MYSEPLMRKNIPVNDPVDFEHECYQIKQVLEKRNKKIHIIQEIASIKNLNDVLNKKPKIIHFICHGDFCQD
jgi:hypothetical protein